MPEKPTKPTPAAKWSNEQIVELPSGNAVRARRPMLYVWLKTGQLDKATEATIRKVVDDKRDETTFEQRQDAMNVLLCKTVVEPEWTLAPREGAVHIDEVCDADRAFLSMMMDIGF